MQTPRGAENPSGGVAVGHAGGLVLIGNLDGVHRGHQAILAEAGAEARARGLVPTVLTFDPHPAEVLGGVAPPMLTRRERKVELIERAVPGVRVVVEPFTQAFAEQSPDEFAERVLQAELDARVVVVGQNFRFGRHRAGDFDALARLGESLGFTTRSHALVTDEGGPLSSTRIRAALRRGDLDEVERMLGRPHMLWGQVVAGERRGRTIGFPTCNLAGVLEALPPFGVYAVLVDRVLPGPGGRPRAEALARGVANLGVRPTVTTAAAPPTLEVHLLDHDEDLYGAELRVHLVDRIRPEQKFADLSALRAQIALDAQSARRSLTPLAPKPEADGAWR